VTDPLLSFSPDYEDAIVCPSPNFGERCNVSAPDMLIMHYTAMESAQAACDWLCSPQSEVSAHYLIDETGMVTQMVAEEHRAWHAGRSFWQGETDINSRSIGIEISNMGHEAGCPQYPDVQIQSLMKLSKSIMSRHDIAARHVLAHSDIAPGRKRDPGEWFPWKRLSENGIGHYVEPTPPTGGRYFMRGETGQPIEALQSMLALYGYNTPVTGVFDDALETNIIAFQQHFRPEKTDGVADMSTIETLHKLLSSL
jgi:N-acetylmuramoyl-L-alanine amidase